MKNLIKSCLILICILLSSCYGTDDDTEKKCNGDCNVFTGRIYREDDIGLANVEVILSYELNQIGANYERIIAKTTTDINGNYNIEGFIKDNEFNTGFFFLRVNTEKIESTLTNNFYKPSDLVNELASKINEYLIPNLTNRSQIINIDYKIPLKTNLIVNLNDFNPILSNDYFRIDNRIKYGFESVYNKYFTKPTNNGYANGVNSTINVPCIFGVNEFKIIRIKNNILDQTNEIINVNNPNTNSPINYTY
jgi:hypothetical protein